MAGTMINTQDGKPVTKDNPLPVVLIGGGGGTPEPGSITTEMFAPDAKAPLSGTADNVAWGGVTGKPSTFPPTIGTSGTTAAAGNHTHTAATTSAAGFMSSADKTKLDGVASNAVNASGAVSAVAAKTQIAALTAITDPTTATAQDIATKLNEIIAALKA